MVSSITENFPHTYLHDTEQDSLANQATRARTEIAISNMFFFIRISDIIFYL